MVKVYGIKTCDSVRKALKFFKDNEIEVDFFDFKKETPSSDNKILHFSFLCGFDMLNCVLLPRSLLGPLGESRHLRVSIRHM